MRRKQEKSMSVEEEIKAVLDGRRLAVARKDARASVRSYSDDVVLFDLAPPLAQPPSAARDPAQAEQWFDTWDGPIKTEIRDLVVKASGDVAFAFGLLQMSGKRTNGQNDDFWSRTTICLERRDGEWRIVHEHNSFPMLMDGSGKAATDLHPDSRRP
jgi:ketosteroid isomerase-like protein